MRPADDQNSSSKIDIFDLATLVMTASRLIGGLANLPLFKNADISLPEWLALLAFSTKEGMSNKMLARRLGVTRQRANQLCTSLREASLISITPAQDDSRRNVINITELAKERLECLNRQLQEHVFGTLGTRSRSLPRASKHMQLVMRMVHAGTAEMAVKSPEETEAKTSAKLESVIRERTERRGVTSANCTS